MSTKVAIHEEKLRALRLDFLRQCPKMMEHLTTDCVRMLESLPDPAAMDRAHRQAHMLAGTAGTFGLIEVSQKARELEDLFMSAVDAGKVPEGASLRLGLDVLQGALNKLLSSDQTTTGGSP